MGHDKRFRQFLQRLTGFRHVVFQHFGKAVGNRWPWQNAVNGHSAAGDIFRQAAGQRELRGLGDAIVDHVRRDIARRFRGDKHHPPPAFADHRREQPPRQAHAGHDVGLPVVVPGRVVGGVEILRAIDPGVIDQNIDAGHGPQQLRCAVGVAEVGDGGARLRARHLILQPGDRGVHALLAAPVKDNLCAALRQAFGDGEANTRRGGGDQRDFSR